jgi:hypothetical protein
MQMTSTRPTAPGWYWYQLPGSWALQPVLIFDGGDAGELGLLYTLEPLNEGALFSHLDGYYLNEADHESLWSSEPIRLPEMPK